MADRPSSQSSAEWRFDFLPESGSGIKTKTPFNPDAAPASHDDITQITVPASTNYDGTSENTPLSVRGSVQMAAVSVVPKMTSVVDIFNGLHPDVKRDLARVSDLAHSPFEFDEEFRAMWKAKVKSTEDPDSGWCVTQKLEEAVSLDMRDVITLTAVKTAGDFSVYPKETVQTIPLRNIIPFNLT
jgi:hypothetical protein